MTDRVYVGSLKRDNRKHALTASLASLGLSGKVKDAKVLDSYLISHEASSESIRRAGSALANPLLEAFTVNDLSLFSKGFDFLVEISFLPGVTDNVGHTARETVGDLWQLHDKDSLKVYSSKIFLFKGRFKPAERTKIALSLHNPLIERSTVIDLKAKSPKNLSLIPPEVNIKKAATVLNVSLDLSDAEFGKLGKEGILDKNGKRRGPLALDLKSMHAIRDYFKGKGRQPTDVELESLAQTWSEHCKHTIFANPIDDIKDGLYKTYIKGATNLIRKKKGRKDFCVSVFSDNSGAVAFDRDFLVTHKVETHNSPSALDPYGGAITGIVGVNRDTLGFGLGAKPVANTYGFCVGDPEDSRSIYRDKERKQKMFPPKRILDGVIKGINSGGNCSGIPTTTGFVKFDDRYKGKPMVFAGTIGLIPRKINGKLSHEKKAEAGDYIVMIGGRVGADGIHGATFSSVVMDANSPATAVQIGDPITQKKFSDAIVREARDMNLYSSITDNGAGGLSCSVAEMARECGGARVELDKVPLKYPGLEPWQIWISESQERMTLAVPPKKWRVFKKLMQDRGVEATIIGEFTGSGKCEVFYEGRRVMDLDMEFLHNGLPKHHQKTEPVINKAEEPKLKEKKSYTDDVIKLLKNKNVSGFAFISEQYDHEVLSSSVLKPLSGRGRINTDAQVIRPVLNSRKGVVSSAALFPSYGDVSAYDMAANAIDATVRNIICAGGTLNHLSILDNFCWSSSDDKKRLWQLKESVRACYESAVEYGTPFISGKDSMFNDFKGYDAKGKPVKISIPPTLLISGISVVDDITRTVSPEFKNEGDIIYLLGETSDELGGGEYYTMLGLTGKNVPKVNAQKNLKIYRALEKAIARGALNSALSLHAGGLAAGLAKAALGGGLGAMAETGGLKGEAGTLAAKLFSESAGRILVSVSPRKTKAFEKMLRGAAFTKLGVVGGKKLTITEGGKKSVDIPVAKLYDAYHEFSNQMK